MRVGTEAKVLDGLTGVLGSTEEDDVRSSRGTECELVESDALTAGLLNTGTGRCGESESSDAQLGNLEETVVVGDGGHDSTDLALISLGGVGVGGGSNDLREGNGRAVDAAHSQTANHGLVEFAVGTTGKECVKLVKQCEVGVVALRGGAVARLDVVFLEIDTNGKGQSTSLPIIIFELMHMM